MTHTYIINVVAPIHSISDKLVSYNKYPIVCISKKPIDDIFKNERVQNSIDKTLEMVGDALLDKALIHVRVVDNKANVTDYEYMVNKVISIWR